MRISKRQLRRIINEEKAKLQEYGGRPYDPTVPGDWERQQEMISGGYPDEEESAKARVDHYKKWVKDHGHITPSSSSVMATYWVDQDRDDPTTQKWGHQVLADEFGIDHDDLSRELKIARKEYDAGGPLSDEELYQRSFKEGKVKISKRQFRRIVKEEKAATIHEWFLSKEKEDRLTKALAGMKATDEEREKIMTALGDESDSDNAGEKNESVVITKRQLMRIIREEKAKLQERYGSGGMTAHGPEPGVDYVMYPDEYTRAAEEYLTDEELTAIGRDKIEGIAIDNANDLAWRLADSLEGFGSSDRAAYIKYYLDNLGSYAARSGIPGFTADWKGPGGSLQVVREGKGRLTRKRLRKTIRKVINTNR